MAQKDFILTSKICKRLLPNLFEYSLMNYVVEGQAVSLEVYGSPGSVGHYRRYTVICPCDTHRADQKVCQKRRTCGPNQCANRGELEPIAYLGAWLQAAPRFEHRSKHVEFNPPLSLVRQYHATMMG